MACSTNSITPDPVVTAFADWSQALSWDALNASTQKAVKFELLDYLGCMIAGRAMMGLPDWVAELAERGGRADALGRYLDDPLQLFLPTRILLGGCYIFAGTLIARLMDVRGAGSLLIFVLSLLAFVVVCEHLLPMALTRRDPEQVLDVLLPAFQPVAGLVAPLTAALLTLGQRRERESSTTGADGVANHATRLTATAGNGTVAGVARRLSGSISQRRSARRGIVAGSNPRSNNIKSGSHRHSKRRWLAYNFHHRPAHRGNGGFGRRFDAEDEVGDARHHLGAEP